MAKKMVASETRHLSKIESWQGGSVSRPLTHLKGRVPPGAGAYWNNSSDGALPLMLPIKLAGKPEYIFRTSALYWAARSL